MSCDPTVESIRLQIYQQIVNLPHPFGDCGAVVVCPRARPHLFGDVGDKHSIVSGPRAALRSFFEDLGRGEIGSEIGLTSNGEAIVLVLDDEDGCLRVSTYYLYCRTSN